MRRFLIGTLVALSIPVMASAAWQVANPFRAKHAEHIANPAFGKTDYPGNYTNNKNVMMHLRHASLRRNIATFAKENNWQVKWRTSSRFHVLLSTQIMGTSFPMTLNRLLFHYPLYAKYNTKKRIVWIFPKKLK